MVGMRAYEIKLITLNLVNSLTRNNSEAKKTRKFFVMPLKNQIALMEMTA